jgi:hypothetical protein
MKLAVICPDRGCLGAFFIGFRMAVPANHFDIGQLFISECVVVEVVNMERLLRHSAPLAFVLCLIHCVTRELLPTLRFQNLSVLLGMRCHFFGRTLKAWRALPGTNSRNSKIMEKEKDSQLTAGQCLPAPLCSPCAWTSEKPVQTGWYWWDPQGPREIGQTSYSGAVEIVKVDVQRWDGKLYMSDDSAYGENPLIDEIPGRWAGPIPFPAENRRCGELGELASELYEDIGSYGDREEWANARAHQAGLIEAVILLEGLFAGAGKGEAL